MKFVLPYLLQSSAYEPHRDEFLYLAEGRHLAWGYLEVPPLMSVFANVTHLMGGGLFWIKLWPSLFGSLTFILVARLILKLGGGYFALGLGFLPFIFGYFLHVHFMFQPNFLEVFFWTLMAYGLIRYVQSRKPGALYLFGLGLGLGLMSKYSVAFFAISLLSGLLLTQERKILLNRHLHYSLLLALAIFMPNLIWQWMHGFPVIYHMKELQHQQLEKQSQLRFVVDQLTYNLPGIYIWVAGLIWVSYSSAGKPYRFIAFAEAAVILMLIAGHGKSYYGMGAYPILFGFGAASLERWTILRRKVWRPAMLAFSVIIGCVVDTIAIPFLPPAQLASYYRKYAIFRKMGFLRWEDQQDHPLPQDFADMLSWRELTSKMRAVYNGLDSAERIQAIFDCDNFGEAGAVDYYGSAYTKPPLMAHSANYLLWVPSNFYLSNIVILSTDDRQEIHDDFIREFQTAAIVDSITNPYAREFGSYILLLKGPSQKFRKTWQEYYQGLKRNISVFH